MTLPNVPVGETLTIVDEDMGNVQRPEHLSGSTAPAADEEAGLIYPSTETNRDSVILLQPHHELAQGGETPRQRKRGHEPDSPPVATPQNGAQNSVPGATDVFEEVDMYGVRTKVRVTTNEAEVRRHIRERDEVAAERDAMAAERTVWKKKVEELSSRNLKMGLELQSIVAQRNDLERNLAGTSQHLTEANRQVANLELRIEKIKSEARGQIEGLKNRMVMAAAEHVKIMGDWEAQRKARELETQKRYDAVQVESATLKEKLNEAFAEIQRLKDQYAAHMRQRREQEMQRIAEDIIRSPQSTQTPRSPAHHARFAVPQTRETPLPLQTPQILHRTIAPSTVFTVPTDDDMTGIIPTVIAPSNHLAHGYLQQPPRPPSRPLADRSGSPYPPGNYPMTARVPPLPAPAGQLPLFGHPTPDINHITEMPHEGVRTLPAINRRPVNAPPSVHSHGPMDTPRAVVNASQDENHNIPSAHNPPTDEPQASRIRAHGQADHAADTSGGEADTEDEGLRLPAMVDIRTVKPRFRRGKQAGENERAVQQRVAQRQVEIIAPPADYSRSRLSRPLLGRLHLPSSRSAQINASSAEQTTRINTSHGVNDARPVPHIQPSRATEFAAREQQRSREQSPPIDPPGSIFGQHNIASARQNGSVEPLLHVPASTRLRRSPTYDTDRPRDPSRTASAINDPPKEAAHRHHEGAGGTRGGEIGADAAAELISSMRAIAEQMRSLPYELATQLKTLNEGSGSGPQEPPYTPPRKNNRHFPFRSPSKKRGRTPMRQELLNIGRPEMNRLLHITEDNGIVRSVGRHVVSLKDLEDYAEGVGAAPVLEPLRICWDDPEAEWNLELADRFQEFLVAKYPAFEGREEEIRDYFIQRIQTLQKIIKERMVREDEDIHAATERVAQKWEQEQRAKRRRTRQRKRLADRLETCRLAAEHDPVYEAMFHVVDRLNIDGMSSDDTDGERYSVRILPWREPDMVAKMELLDRLRDQLTVYGNRRPGGLPHPRDRRVTQAESEREAPATLPRNLYRQTWLMGLSQFQLMRLDPSEEIVVPGIERVDW
ncbi:hypothetical protein CVT26_004183 [Gymnopilus dilepis]|uniref:Uncharacterized protein n=1 Tax=Gymnopilus dilepis TaxID=231916 RepID=A0A409WQ39_9AGAR|nr:hypothetical protein CVT26_004183 [Gymnopilus dilepis]